METTMITLEEVKPKFKDQDDRYNNWYFSTSFSHNAVKYSLKISIREGTLMGQQTFLALSRDAVHLSEDEDCLVLEKSRTDFNVINESGDIQFSEQPDRFSVEMGDIKAECREDQRRVVCTNPKISVDLTFTPRGPVFYWGKEKGALCVVTEETHVAGIESMSNVSGHVIIDGEKINVESSGLFERVWFGKLNFFQIRIMNWCYANFDELYTYVCHCESADNESRPFHFETGKIYLPKEKQYLFIKSFEVVPESWVYLEEAKRFIPWEQSLEASTDLGRLNLNIIPTHYPQLLQAPIRFENFVADNIPGWFSIFYDLPVELEGNFTFDDGKVIELRGGKGVNELIRLVPL